MVLDGLEAPDGTAELEAVLGVLDGHVQDTLRVSQELAGLDGGGPLQGAPDHGPAFADAAQHRAGGDVHVAEDHLALSVRRQGLQGRPLEAGGIRRDDEQGHAPLRVGGLACSGRHQQIVGNVGVLREELPPVDGEVAGAPLGLHVLDAPGVPPGAGLGQRQGGQKLPPGDLGQKLLLLGLGAGIKDGRSRQHHRGEEGPGEQGPAHLLRDQAEVQEVATAAAQLRREGQPGPPQVGQLRPHLRREPPGVLLGLSDIADGALTLQELPGAALQHLLGLGEA